MQKVPYFNPENDPCDQYKGDLLDDEVEGGSPLINSYISADITSYHTLKIKISTLNYRNHLISYNKIL